MESKRDEQNMNPYYRCYAEIDLEAIGHNLREVRKRVSGETKVMAVIKADATGMEPKRWEGISRKINWLSILAWPHWRKHRSFAGQEFSCLY